MLRLCGRSSLQAARISTRHLSSFLPGDTNYKGQWPFGADQPCPRKLVGLVFSLDLRLHNHLKITGGSVSESNLRRLAGVSDPERSEGERESAAEIPSAARELAEACASRTHRRRDEPTSAGCEVEAPSGRERPRAKRRGAGVRCRNPERSEGAGGSVSESNRPEPGKTRLTPVLKTGMITGPHALPRAGTLGRHSIAGPADRWLRRSAGGCG